VRPAALPRVIKCLIFYVGSTCCEALLLHDRHLSMLAGLSVLDSFDLSRCYQAAPEHATSVCA
jgi:hypothetical protein